jgi:hypothetical protein
MDKERYHVEMLKAAAWYGGVISPSHFFFTCWLAGVRTFEGATSSNSLTSKARGRFRLFTSRLVREVAG